MITDVSESQVMCFDMWRTYARANHDTCESLTSDWTEVMRQENEAHDGQNPRGNSSVILGMPGATSTCDVDPAIRAYHRGAI